MLVATNWRPDSSVRSAPPADGESAPAVLGSPQNTSRLSEANILMIADWLEGTINILDIEEQSVFIDAFGLPPSYTGGPNGGPDGPRPAFSEPLPEGGDLPSMTTARKGDPHLTRHHVAWFNRGDISWGPHL